MNLDNLTKIVQHEINAIAQVNKLKSLCCQLSITAKDYSTIINISPNFIAQKNLGGSYDTIIHEVSEDNSVYHSPIEIFNLIMESKKISPNTKLNYKRTKELLIEFAPLASYQDIDKRFIRAFEIYLTRKNLCANTIRELPTPKGMSFGENSPLFFPASFCHCFLGHEVVHPQEGSPQA